MVVLSVINMQMRALMRLITVYPDLDVQELFDHYWATTVARNGRFVLALPAVHLLQFIAELSRSKRALKVCQSVLK